MSPLFCLLLFAGILQAEGFNCTADEYIQDRMEDCFITAYAEITFHNLPSECSMRRTALESYDPCIDTALLGCADLYIDEYRFVNNQYYWWDEAEAGCVDTGIFDAPGLECGEDSQEEGYVDLCLDDYEPILFSVSQSDPNYCSVLGPALTQVKECIDLAAVNCTNEGRSGLYYYAIHLEDEVAYLDICTEPTDPSIDCGTIDTSHCFSEFDVANMTITTLISHDYCLEMIDATDALYACVYQETLAVGCRTEFLDGLDEMASIRGEVVATCGSSDCFVDQVLQSTITADCLGDIVSYTTDFTSGPRDEQSCLGFRDKIGDAEMCTKEDSLSVSCLYNEIEEYMEIFDAYDTYTSYCGLNNETCFLKVVECDEIAANVVDSINEGAGSCSSQESQLKELDWCITEALSVGRCTWTEVAHLVNMSSEFRGSVTGTCGVNDFCVSTPGPSIKSRCVEPLHFSLTNLANAIPGGEPDFCLNFEEEIAEAKADCPSFYVVSSGCPTDFTLGKPSLTAYYDYIADILCESDFASNLASCTSPAIVASAVGECGYGMKVLVSDLTESITNDNMEDKCRRIESHLNDTHSCLDAVMTDQACAGQFSDIYDLIEQDAYPDPSVCDATATTTPPPPTTTTPPPPTTTTTPPPTTTTPPPTTTTTISTTTTSPNENGGGGSGAASVGVSVILVPLTTFLACFCCSIV